MSKSAATNSSAVAKQCTAKGFSVKAYPSQTHSKHSNHTKCAEKKRISVNLSSTRELKEMVTTRRCPSGSLRQPKSGDFQTRLTMKRPIEERKTRETTPLHQSPPPKLIQQSRHTSSAAVVTLHEPSCTTLNHLQSTHITSSKRVPGSNSILQMRSHQ